MPLTVQELLKPIENFIKNSDTQETTTGEIVEFIGENYPLDSKDLELAKNSKNQKVWERTVRNSIGSLKDSFWISHIAREKYSAPRKPPTWAITSESRIWREACLTAQYHLDGGLKLETSYNNNSYWVSSVGRKAISITKCSDGGMQEPPQTHNDPPRIVTTEFDKQYYTRSVKYLLAAGGEGYWGTISGNRRWYAECITALCPFIALDGDAAKMVPPMKLHFPETIFDPGDIVDRRKRETVEQVVREGQEEFRSSILEAYDETCPISGCKVVKALDAAHIDPYMGPASNHLQNGFPLRKDLHALFDAHMISIDPESMDVVVSDSLTGTNYEDLRGRSISDSIPVDPRLKPSSLALSKHHSSFVKKNR